MISSWFYRFGGGFLDRFLGSFFLYSLNYPTETEENLNSLFYQGNKIADDLTSAGFPEDWNNLNVIKIGLFSDEEINETKLERFYDFASTDYLKTKSLFNTRYQYYVNFSQIITIGETPISHIGSYPTETKSIIKISRIVPYKNKSTVMDVYIWEK